MAAMETLKSLLQSLEALKPPGASQKKIQEITTLCIENIQSEATIAQELFRQFKKTPTTHKLGVLYVVDSVMRQWMTLKTKENGRQLTGQSAAAGTFAAGVHKMTEIIPLMMNDLLVDYPDTQKEKIKRLVDIWEQSKTLSEPIVASIKRRLDPDTAAQVPTTIATQVPAPVLPQQNGSAPSMPDTSNLLAALAAFSNPNVGTQAASMQLPLTMPASTTPQAYGIPNPLVSNMHASAHNFATNGANSGQAAAPASIVPPPVPFHGMNGSSSAIPPPQPTMQEIIGNPAVMQILEAMANGSISYQQGGQLLSYLGLPSPAPGTLLLPQPPIAGMVPPVLTTTTDNRTTQSHQIAQHERGRDDRGHDYQGQRDRSRSPDRGRRNYSPPNRRDSPTYDTYDPLQAAEGNVRGRQENDRRGRGRGRGNRNDFRQRSPPAPRRQPGNEGRAKGSKNVEFDHGLPQGTIRVLSRTLFAGGVTIGDDELRSIFSNFGSVQTCVVNREKRHAFIKMFTRDDAIQAKQGMENIDHEIQDKVRSTRWGVGFGRREFSDYTTGISEIPIDTLTDADRKWVVTAEYGGTGGVELESGMVIEEPDIEIGAGVSSKAISKRMGPEQGAGRGRGGGNRGFQGNHHGGRGGRNRHQHHQGPPSEARRAQSPAVRPEANTVGVPPPVPGFGFSFPGLPDPR